MATRRRRRRRSANRDRAVLAGLLIGSALMMALVAVLVMNITRRIVNVRADEQAQRVQQRTQAIEMAQNSVLSTAIPMPTAVPDAQTVPETTAEPAATPEPTAEPQPAFEYLPVISKGETSEKKIAITVDDCFQVNNMKKIIQLAYDNGGKLTLFPIGQNLSKNGMADALKVAVFKLGFEVENHTWSHARIFRLSEEEMAAEIWQQRNAVNNALGVNYQQHFFRLMGGDGEYDQRTHNYLKQLGFLAVADWTISGSDASLKHVQNNMKPGTVYLFHTTDRDTKLLEKFIPWVAEQGYQMVTLNEMFGLPENATYDLSTAEISMPIPQPYTVEYVDLKDGDYSWSVVQLQEKLWELGYLDSSSDSALENSPADGDFGPGTAEAVRRFQADNGLPATGIADIHTQEVLFGDAEA